VQTPTIIGQPFRYLAAQAGILMTEEDIWPAMQEKNISLD
jgi:hypothetical protein